MCEPAALDPIPDPATLYELMSLTMRTMARTQRTMPSTPTPVHGPHCRFIMLSPPPMPLQIKAVKVGHGVYSCSAEAKTGDCNANEASRYPPFCVWVSVTGRDDDFWVGRMWSNKHKLIGTPSPRPTCFVLAISVTS